MKKKSLLMLLLLALSISNLSVSLQYKGKLDVNINHIKNKKGHIVVALFKNAKGFPEDTDQAFRIKKIRASEIRHQISFYNVEPNNYALAVFHDENSNGKLDVNFFGIPTEGMAVSNNIDGSWSAPSFAEAKFTFTKNHSLIINIIN
ncbi:MAG: DUF2141 domain-containing protein [Crocinitomicaceae bacterium]